MLASSQSRPYASSDSGTSAISLPKTEDAAAPVLTLPKGGGAIRGIGEKFSANAVTGTASITVPIATSPGRSGFGPQLSLSYDSGAGNGPFGLGWRLSLPSITRKTDKGLPVYNDAEESDTYILSGAEDLVRSFQQDQDGTVVRDAQGNPVLDTQDRETHIVQRYRPRIEGGFARIERWTRKSDGDIHWRSITRENVTTFYGKTPESRISDPIDPSRVSSWLICERHDDKGNAIVYEYNPEDSDRVFEDAAGQSVALAHERNRTSVVRSANRYLKRVKYGNRTPNRDADGNATDPTELADWMFEVQFDYGEGHYSDMPPDADGNAFVRAQMQEAEDISWPVRRDPFSSYRAGFEVRTYRLCRRVLMFHHFPDELGIADCLVRSTEFVYGEDPVATTLAKVIQSGYLYQPDQNTENRYLKRSLPPLEFTYSKVPGPDRLARLPIEEIDDGSLASEAGGLVSGTHQWVDLDGEGSSGILTDHAGSWIYKRNVSANNVVRENGTERTSARFGPGEQVATRPVASLSRDQAQFLDLAGDGHVDLVQMTAPIPGFYERTGDQEWESFRVFTSWPEIDIGDSNLRFVDLDGDGHADALLTEQDVLAWHPSHAEAGFGPAQRVVKPTDEERGPKLVFADGEGSIFLADMSGDGLTDLVRIHNGEVCYWPNLGYGQFGAKVTMDNAPWFDTPNLFDPRRILLADIDGSGVTDILYLHRDGVKIYFNEAGNRWGDEVSLPQFPAIDDLSTVQAMDLLGSGTACLVWSSPLPGDAGHAMRYIDVMDGQKPHLMVRMVNNLGAETHVQYAPSTRYFLNDKQAGRPWITRLPFPVHVIERVETLDRVSQSRFVTRYAYHHGYFDGAEREFRGFGMVEQWDTEEFAALRTGGNLSDAVNIDEESHVPPVHTKTWFHTGAFVDGADISRQQAREYFGAPLSNTAEFEDFWATLLNDTVLPEPAHSAEETREACRTLKGSMLRQEIYADDGSPSAKVPYTASERNYAINVVQPRDQNRHGVFFVHPLESITYQYERDVADPRVQHEIVLEVDQFGTPRKSVAIGYGRRQSDLEDARDREKQTTTLITYTESDLTNTIDAANDYRVAVIWQARTYELTGFNRRANEERFTADDFVHVQNGQLALRFDSEIPYEASASNGRQRRLIEQVRTRYRPNDLGAAEDDVLALLPDGQIEPLALPGENYKLAFTPGLLAQVYQRPHEDQPPESLLPDPAAVLGGQGGDQGGYVDLDNDGRWWVPAGRVFYHPDQAATPAQELTEARNAFFQPRRSVDPFGQSTAASYDDHALLTTGTSDAVGNTVAVTNDYRVLKPSTLVDPNRNRTAVAFDALGLVAATAIMGKSDENLGDSLQDVVANVSLPNIQAFLANPFDQASALLGQSTTRIVHDFSRYQRTGQPPLAATLARETHVHQLNGVESKIQMSFAYSDGFGREIQTKVQAEAGDAPQREQLVALPTGDVRPGDLVHDAEGDLVTGNIPRRWVGSGRVVLNNKGNPVRKYEQFFSATHLYEPEREMTDTGVSPVLMYDPMERVVVTLHPDHTYEKAVFDAWQQATFDRNDTVVLNPAEDDDVNGYIVNPDATPRIPTNEYLPTWHAQRIGNQLGAADRDAAEKAAAHAGTPAVMHFDALGRAFLTIAHNRFERDGAVVEEHNATRVELDVEGNQRVAIDAKDRVVMRYDYDLLANRIHEASMDGGERWMIGDATAKLVRAWDSRGFMRRMTYDEMRRLTGLFVSEDGAERLVERTVYGEAQGDANNHRTRVHQVFDGVGIATSVAYDFKGNVLESRRDLLSGYKQAVDWSQGPTADDGSFTTSTIFDALNRPVSTTSPDGSVHHPEFNESNLLEGMDVNLRGAAAATSFISNIDYNAKGQRERIAYGNGATANYEYDPLTFRLMRLRTTRPANPDATASQLFQDVSVVQDVRYTFDPVGNITRIEDAALKTVVHNGEQVAPVSSYTYDAFYQVTEASGREHIGQTAFDFNPVNSSRRDFPFAGAPAHPNNLQQLRTYTERYEYDEVGNIDVMRHIANSGGWTRTYAYEEDSLLDAAVNNNRLTSTTVGNGVDHVAPYTHDAHGNMTSMPGLAAMVWDFKDQLHQVDLGGGGTAYYVYDQSGQRVRKVIESQSGTRRKERIWVDGFEVYREYNGGENDVALERESLHVMDGERRIALVETQTIADGNQVNDPVPLQRCQLGNHIGSSSLELDGNGALISYEEFHSYGTTAFQAGRTAAEVSPKRYRYTGKERDEETGFSYHGARYFASWLARWTSCDPIWDVERHNLYIYVRNNPVRYVDPKGAQPEDPEQPHFQIEITTEGVRVNTGPKDEVEPQDEIEPPQTAGSGGITLYDSIQRGRYSKRIKGDSAAAVDRVRAARSGGDVTGAERAAREAFDLRNEARASTQRRLTPGGRALSNALEQERSWDDLFRKYSQGADTEFDTFEEIAKSSGRTRGSLKLLAAGGKALGWIGTLLGLGVAGVEITSATPEERPRVVGENVGGIAGGAIGTGIGTATGVVAVGLLVSNPAGWMVLGGAALFGAAGGYAGSEIGEIIGSSIPDYLEHVERDAEDWAERVESGDANFGEAFLRSSGSWY